MLRFVECKKEASGVVDEIAPLGTITSLSLKSDDKTGVKLSGSISHKGHWPSDVNVRVYYSEDGDSWSPVWTLKAITNGEELGSIDEEQSDVYDFLWYLSKKRTSEMVTIMPNEPLLAVASKLVSACGLYVNGTIDMTIRAIDGLAYDIGTPYIDVINGILAVAGYQPATTDALGRVEFINGRAQADMPSILRGKPKKTPHADDTANAVVVVYQGNAGTYTSKALLMDDSELSIWSRGYEITHIEKVKNLGLRVETPYAIQQAIDAIAKKKLIEIVKAGSKWSVSTEWKPELQAGSILTGGMPDGSTGSFLVSSLSIDATPLAMIANMELEEVVDE